MRVAVLMACHNRKALTLACLEALRAQHGVRFVAPEAASRAEERGMAPWEVSVFLVDDASSDGTAPAVRAAFPEVVIIEGDGALFWCGGMRRAWERAAQMDFDAYVWLNDDTMLEPDAFERLFRTLADADEAAVVVGACRDPETGAITYGGMDARFGLLEPLPDRPRACESFHGNVVVIPRAVYRKVGGMSGAYTHSLGDVDYAERARRAGVPMLLAPGFVARCRGNGVPRWQRGDLSLGERWRALHAPTGCPPGEYARFFRLKHGWKWPLVMAKMYLRLLFPGRSQP
ncbi:MAG: glycosyltransferase family 2 protein [Verrucomicrobia bacterium]|nr:MAG: glycosyltransferase family 2 protein [Verrucomicrobiota bacterium]